MTRYLPVLLNVLVATWLGMPAVAQSEQNDPSASVNSDPSEESAPPGVAVVELFTSQGCSSCPPADAVLRQIAAAAKKTGRPVYTLSFHVDYWNRLGWRDPYSDAAYSYRQRAYARAAGSKRVYTPQMVVGGSVEFNGSDRRKAIAAIIADLNRKPAASVQLTRKSNADDEDLNRRITIRYKVNGPTTGRRIYFAIVSTPKPNQIEKGENAGRTLTHVNVVREFRSVPLDDPPHSFAGVIELPLPDLEHHTDPKIIAFVQSPESAVIEGATAIDCAPSAEG